MYKYCLLFLGFLFFSPVLVVSASETEIETEIESDVSSGNVADNGALVDLLTSIDENLETMAIETTVNAYQVSEYYVNYFRGVLQNMNDTDYLCYAERVYTSTGTGYNNYITHYYLLYDLVIEDGQIVSGSYPCIDVYSENSIYYMEQYSKTFDGYPTMGYASFSPYSALIDRSFPVDILCVSLIAVAVLWILGKKTLFS